MSETLSTWRLLRQQRRQWRQPAAAQTELQSALLRDAVRHAHERVPLYRRLWGEAGFDPGSVRGVEDLASIPPLGSGEARSGFESRELIADGVDPARLPAFPSSGSTGPPLRVPRGALEQHLWRGVALSIWLEHGYRWRDVTAQLDRTAGSAHPLQRLGISRTEWISPELPAEEQARRLAAAGAGVVAGTPTVLRRVAGAARAAGIELPGARIVFTQGELPDARTSELVRGAFGVAPIALYGSTEGGHAAWQCERRDGYHVNAGTCLVEVVRDGQPARSGETGRVLLTTLRARTAPLIRYDTGDLATAANGACGCGRPFRALEAIEGRAREQIVLGHGRRLTTRAVVERMAPLVAPDGYRLCQEAPDRFLLHLEEPAPAGAVERLRGLLGEVEIEAVSGVPEPPSRIKSRPVEAALRTVPEPAR